MMKNVLLPPHMAFAEGMRTPGGGTLLLLQTQAQTALVQAELAWEADACAKTFHAVVFGCRRHGQFRKLCRALAVRRIAITGLQHNKGVLRLFLRGFASTNELNAAFRSFCLQDDMDVNFLTHPPVPSLQRTGLLIMDMDSTLIRCECIDEIADMLGLKEQVASITQRAMEGELDFAASLKARVRLLAGLPVSYLDRVYRERIRLNRGAIPLIRTLKAHGWKVCLVSGGFRFFTDRLHHRLRLDFSLANRLEVKDGRLTGRVLGKIVDGEAKKKALISQAARWDIDRKQTVAVGDGANDLPMLRASGMGIAFHGKALVRKEAPFVLCHGGLDRVLELISDGSRSNCE